MSLWLIFLTGLTTGGLSCLAVQGGLLMSVVVNQKTNRWLATVMFLLAKLTAYAILGWLLGSLGSVITLSLEVRVIFQVLTALFMLATAANLLEVHPIFRYLTFQTPRFLQRLVRKSSKSEAVLAPVTLGLLTIFMPCGITQAMEVLAINSGKPLSGALIMASFVLGTMPVFSLIGLATAKISEVWHKNFMMVTAVILTIMAGYTINAALVTVGSPLGIRIQATQKAGEITTEKGVQTVTIKVTSQGYGPNYIQVKQGVPVELILVSDNVRSCAAAFVFKEFGIRTVLGVNDKQVFKFTPENKGKFTFSCSMGMYSGVMEVK